MIRAKISLMFAMLAGGSLVVSVAAADDVDLASQRYQCECDCRKHTSNFAPICSVSVGPGPGGCSADCDAVCAQLCESPAQRQKREATEAAAAEQRRLADAQRKEKLLASFERKPDAPPVDPAVARTKNACLDGNVAACAQARIEPRADAKKKVATDDCGTRRAACLDAARVCRKPSDDAFRTCAASCMAVQAANPYKATWEACYAACLATGQAANKSCGGLDCPSCGKTSAK